MNGLQFPNFRQELIGMGGVSPMSGPSNGMGMSSMGAGNSMDVMGSLKQHQAYGTRFQSDPSGGMMGGMGSFGGFNYGG